MHVKNSKNILTLIIGGRLKSENSFEHFSLIIIKLNWILIITILFVEFSLYLIFFYNYFIR